MVIVHFINFNNYYQKNPIFNLAFSELMENFEEIKDEVTFKVWTEDNLEIKRWIKKSAFCKDFINNNYKLYEYLKLKILYKYGGFISEPDHFLCCKGRMKEVFSTNAYSWGGGFTTWLPLFFKNRKDKELKRVTKNYDFFAKYYKSTDIYNKMCWNEGFGSSFLTKQQIKDYYNSGRFFPERHKPIIPCNHLNFDCNVCLKLAGTTKMISIHSIKVENNTIVIENSNHTAHIWFSDDLFREDLFLSYCILKMFQADPSSKSITHLSGTIECIVNRYKTPEALLSSDDFKNAITYEFPLDNNITFK